MMDQRAESAGTPDRVLASNEEIRRDLGRKAVEGGALVAAARLYGIALRIVALSVLGNLLSPEDFGVVALAAVVGDFAAVLRDFGLATAVIQREKLEPRQLSNLFWIGVVATLAATAVVAGAGPVLEAMYGRPELVAVCLVSSLSILISGTAQVPSALLQRRMANRQIAMGQVIAATVSFAIAVAFAVLGAGYWALVAQSVVNAAVVAALLWKQARWLPTRWQAGVDVKPLLRVSGGSAASHLSVYVARNADNAVVGKVTDLAQLGLYTRAYQFVLIPEQLAAPVSAVAMPALARLQDDPERFRHFFRRAIGLLTLVTMPVVAAMAALAHLVFPALMGPNWNEAVPIFRMLAVGSFVMTLGPCTAWVLSATGRTDRQWRINAVFSGTLLLSFVAGAPWGAIGVAAASSVASLLGRAVAIPLSFRGTPVRTSDLVDAVWRNATVAILAGVVAFVASGVGWFPTQVHVALLVGCLVYTLAWFALWVVVPGGVAQLRGIVADARALRRGRLD
jgi:O-antigen/teichoic acid export membrane protein